MQTSQSVCFNRFAKINDFSDFSLHFRFISQLVGEFQFFPDEVDCEQQLIFFYKGVVLNLKDESSFCHFISEIFTLFDYPT